MNSTALLRPSAQPARPTPRWTRVTTVACLQVEARFESTKQWTRTTRSEESERSCITCYGLGKLGWKPSIKEEEALQSIDKQFHVPETADLQTKYDALQAALFRDKKLMMQLTELYPDLLLNRLTERFDDLILSLALTEMASEKNAPKYVKTLRNKYFERLVEQEMTPKEFMGVLRLQEDEEKRNRYASLKLFLKAYNKKNKKAKVSLLDALRSSGYWESDDLLLHQLRIEKITDTVARQVYRELALESMDKLFDVLETADPGTEFRALIFALGNEKLIRELTDEYQDLLVRRLAKLFDDLSLSRALTELAFKENAPKCLITLRDKHFERLVGQEMTPEEFVQVCRRDVPDSKKLG
ncbi:hypothetical protein PsorP6_013228 [Peronosclerospora sorghi]|uniref:Uncharacterized protein n=1 Tax=Peronosclerospora sorghi TaxID=230839 RepID=A0ACC0WEY1_9STRA|nr:hypothetical protein PsorP6_013228 [Peronosclerospora sorghi]